MYDSDAGQSAACIELLERQVAERSSESAWERGDKTRFEEFVTVTQCQLTDAQPV